jgi:hypothetical protein
VPADDRGGPGFGGDDGGQHVGRVQRRERRVGVGGELGSELRVEVPTRAAPDFGNGGGAPSATRLRQPANAVATAQVARPFSKGTPEARSVVSDSAASTSATRIGGTGRW